MDTLIVFSTRFLSIFIEAAPFLLLGTLTSGLLEAFVSPGDLVRLIPRNPILAAFTGGLMGFIFPVGECGVLPVARRLHRKGLPTPVSITFLLAGPVINPIVIASTYIAFHERALEIVYLRVAVTLVVAVSTGIVFSFQSHPERLLREPIPVLPDAPAAAEPPSPQRMDLLPGLRYAFLLAAKEFFEIGRYLVLGSLLAASMRIFVTQHALEALATNPVNSVPVMLVLAFVLSIGSTTDAFVARGFTSTLAQGSIVSFLAFGPMADLKNAILFMGVFRRRVVLYLILLPFLMTTLITIWINLNVKF